MNTNRDAADILKHIEDSVYRGDVSRARDILHQSTQTNAISAQSLIDALNQGMERARSCLKDASFSLPDFLFSIDAFRQGLKLVRSSDCKTSEPDKRVLIGVVEGEVHDLGKSIVAAVLEASGFHIIDLGSLSRDRTLVAIKEHRPCIVALSAMMSTCISGMQDTIIWVRKLHPELKILVGGAALDADLATSIGAHGYADSAVTTPDEARRLIQAM